MPGNENEIALTSSRLFDGEAWHENHAVLVKGENIVALCPANDIPANIPITDLGDATLAPGLIDIQVNGGGGELFNNRPDPETVAKIAMAHRRFGTTGIMPTIISDTPAVQQAAASAVATARARGELGVLGLHIEGPCFAPAKRGTHKASMIRTLQQSDLDWLCQLQAFPVILTLAPEHAEPGQIAALTESGLILCAGHTEADIDCIKRAIAAGLRGFTHLFNAMSPLTARSPGAIGAALEDTETWAGIIADGHHVHPANIKLAQRCKPRGKLLLVSDAMATVGAQNDSFELYGERIQACEGRLVNAEGKLSGSAIALIDAVQIAHRQAGIALDECLRMASLYPATFLQLEQQLGRLRAGYRADIISFDSDFNVGNTWVAGVAAAH